tara:strand:- start:245 stop:382 length:138 start_codon:yes stop_codon:yes gene_type:complete
MVSHFAIPSKKYLAGYNPHVFLERKLIEKATSKNLLLVQKEVKRE